jgi:hypothetical protein
MKIYEPSIQSKNYNDPISMGAHFLFQIRPQNSMKFNDKIFLKKTILETDTGSFVTNMVKEEITTPSYIDRTSAEKSLANLSSNVADTGL